MNPWDNELTFVGAMYIANRPGFSFLILRYANSKMAVFPELVGAVTTRFSSLPYTYQVSYIAHNVTDWIAYISEYLRLHSIESGEVE